MPQQDQDAAELKHAEEIVGVVFVARDQSAEPLEPGEQALHGLAPFIAPQLPPILGFAAVSAVRRDHLDSVLLVEVSIQRVGIVRLVPDDPFGQLAEEAAGKRFVDELGLVRRGAIHGDGQRKTGSSGEGHDLRPLAPFGFPDGEAPFFALAKLPSISASFSSSRPSPCSFFASARRVFSNCPERTHRWKRPCTVWYGGYRSGSSRHCAPVRKIHSTT